MPFASFSLKTEKLYISFKSTPSLSTIISFMESAHLVASILLKGLSTFRVLRSAGGATLWIIGLCLLPPPPLGLFPFPPPLRVVLTGAGGCGKSWLYRRLRDLASFYLGPRAFLSGSYSNLASYLGASNLKEIRN